MNVLSVFVFCLAISISVNANSLCEIKSKLNFTLGECSKLKVKSNEFTKCMKLAKDQYISKRVLLTAIKKQARVCITEKEKTINECNSLLDNCGSVTLICESKLTCIDALSFWIRCEFSPERKRCENISKKVATVCPEQPIDKNENF